MLLKRRSLLLFEYVKNLLFITSVVILAACSSESIKEDMSLVSDPPVFLEFKAQEATFLGNYLNYVYAQHAEDFRKIRKYYDRLLDDGYQGSHDETLMHFVIMKRFDVIGNYLSQNLQQKDYFFNIPFFVGLWNDFTLAKLGSHQEKFFFNWDVLSQVNLKENFLFHMPVSAYLTIAGHSEEALRVLDSVDPQYVPFYVLKYYRALILKTLGRDDEAFQMYEDLAQNLEVSAFEEMSYFFVKDVYQRLRHWPKEHALFDKAGALAVTMKERIVTTEHRALTFFLEETDPQPIVGEDVPGFLLAMAFSLNAYMLESLGADVDLLQLQEFFLRLSMQISDKLVLNDLQQGILLMKLKKYEEAVEFYDALSQKSSWQLADFFSLYRRLIVSVELYDSVSNFEENIHALEAFHPNTLLVDRLKEKYYLKRNDQANLKKLYEKQIYYYENQDKTPHTQNLLLSIYYQMGLHSIENKNYELAEVYYEKALALNPDSNLIINDLSYVWLLQNKNIEKAIELLKDTVSKDEDNPYYLDSLGWAYYLQGNYELAEINLVKSVESKANIAIVYDHLAHVYWKQGMYQQARYQWQHILFHQLKDSSIDLKRIEQYHKKGLPSSL